MPRIMETLAGLVGAGARRRAARLASEAKASATGPLIALETLGPAGVDAARLRGLRARRLHAERHRLSLACA